jgi:hypothetical protein
VVLADGGVQGKTMDETVEWVLSDDVNELVKVITKVKNTFRLMVLKNSDKAKVITFDAYAPPKLFEFLKIAENWTTPDEGLTLDFGTFQLHSDKVLSDDNIRVVIDIEHGDSHPSTMFADVIVKT